MSDGSSSTPSRREAPEEPGAVAATVKEQEAGDRTTPVAQHAGMAVLTLGALGVVFGDIGTSPLYALQTVFHADHGAVPTTPSAVYGVFSLVFWSITIIVSLKYLTFIMRADNEGEGGIMALIALIKGAGPASRAAQVALVALGIFGAALFYGDGMITPAISVLSAVEGLEVVSPSLDSLVIPIALTILTALFMIQRFGTGAVGRFFGPVMGLWFAVLAIAGDRPDRRASRASCERSRRPTRSSSSSTTAGRRSWRSARWSSRSRARRRSTPTWATSGDRRSGGRGSCSSSPRCRSTTSARAR